MSRIPVYYTVQNYEDSTLNMFFLPSSYKNPQDLRVRDIVDHFPMRLEGKFYHFRFSAFCDRDVKSWVDISNLNAKVPTVDGNIILKVLVLDRAAYSRIFRSHRPQEQPVSQPQPEVRREHSREQPKEVPREQPREVPKQTHQQTHIKKPQSEPVRNVQPRANPNIEANLLDDDDDDGFNVKSQPQQQTKGQQQQQPQQSSNNNKGGIIDFDLLGPGGAEEVKTNAQSSVNKSTNVKNENKIENWSSHEDLTRQLEQKKQDAIQEKLDQARQQWDIEQKNQVDREKAYVELEDTIRKWSGKDGQRNNIRTLLCTVHSIMWDGANWNPLSFSDLMNNGSVKKFYYKAVTIFHPDKNQEGNYKQKYISERVTNELNAAWDEFRKTNP